MRQIEIFFARHGESVDDLSDSYGGASDFVLSDGGRSQAAELGKLVEPLGVQHIFSSPLRRAKETAEIVRGELTSEVDLTVIPGLRERNTYGLLSGLPKAEAADIFAYLIEDLEGQPGKDKTCMPGGEEYEPFVGRVLLAWHAVVSACLRDSLDKVLVVTHGKVTLAMFSEILHVGDEYDQSLGALKHVKFTLPHLQ